MRRYGHAENYPPQPAMPKCALPMSCFGRGEHGGFGTPSAEQVPSKRSTGQRGSCAAPWCRSWARGARSPWRARGHGRSARAATDENTKPGGASPACPARRPGGRMTSSFMLRCLPPSLRWGIGRTKAGTAEFVVCRSFELPPAQRYTVARGSVGQRPGASRDERAPAVLLAGSPRLVPRRDQRPAFAADRPEVWDRLREVDPVFETSR